MSSATGSATLKVSLVSKNKPLTLLASISSTLRAISFRTAQTTCDFLKGKDSLSISANSGLSSSTKSWKPENAIEGYEPEIPDVKPPPVGAGQIVYVEGFEERPIDAFGDPAEVGENHKAE